MEGVLSKINNAGPIEPIVEIKQNLVVWSQGAWRPFRVEFIEPIPPSSQTLFDMGAIAAQGTVQKAIIAILQLEDNNFLQVRWKPIDDVEGILWEQSSQGRFSIRRLQSRVSKMLDQTDPHAAMSQFYILGKDRDAFIEARNPTDYAATRSVFLFWAYKYLIAPLTSIPTQATYLPAEGLMAPIIGS